MSDDSEKGGLSPSVHDAYMEVLRRISGQPTQVAAEPIDPEHGHPYAGETFAERQKNNNERFRAEKMAKDVLHGAGELGKSIDNAVTSNLLAPVSRGIHRAEAGRAADAQRRAYANNADLQAEQWRTSQANQSGAGLGPAWNDPLSADSVVSSAMEGARAAYEATRAHVSAERLRSAYNSIPSPAVRGAQVVLGQTRRDFTAARAKQDAAALLDAAAIHAHNAHPAAVPPQLAAHQAQQVLQTAQLIHAIRAATTRPEPEATDVFGKPDMTNTPLGDLSKHKVSAESMPDKGRPDLTNTPLGDLSGVSIRPEPSPDFGRADEGGQ